MGVLRCSRCLGHCYLVMRWTNDTWPYHHSQSLQCPICKGTGEPENQEAAVIDMTKPEPGPKTKSSDILTEVMSQLIDVSNDMVWFNFEEASANERSKGIERKLWNLRGTLGDYVHALREEGK